MEINNEVIGLAKNALLEAQKERDSLMRWKLILVSVIGAASLGFSQDSLGPNSKLALCLIPFTCIYVDILCRNLSIRAKMVSLFLADEMHEPLEEFYQRYIEPRGNSLETYALRYSTIFLSLLVIPIGIISYADEPRSVNTWLNDWKSALFCFSGVSGIIVSWFVERRYQAQKKSLKLMVTPQNNQEQDNCEIIRSKIEHEDTLRDNRTTWMLTIQGFLIAGAGIFWQESQGFQTKMVITIICILAILLLTSFIYTIRFNDKAIENLIKKGCDLHCELVLLIGYHVNIDELSSKKQVKKFLLWNFMPISLIMFWIVIIVIVWSIETTPSLTT